MKSNYKRLGDYIRQIDVRNKNLISNNLLGINIDKFFMPSVANIIGTDLSNYKIIKKGQFACNPMHVGRDERIPVSLYLEENSAIVSPAYIVFEISNNSLLNKYLMLWFRRSEFDRECWFYTDASVRGGITWEDFCDMKLPIPSIEEQQKIVDAYETIEKRIAIKKKINENLEKQALQIYNEIIKKEDERVESIYHCISVINGSPYASEYFNNENKGFPLVRIRDLEKCNPDIYTNEILKNVEYVNAGDILIGMDGEFVPHIWYGKTGVLNQRVCKVIPLNENIHPLYVYFTLKPILMDIQRTQGGTTVIHLGKKDFDKMTCKVINIANQKSFYSSVFPIYNNILDNYKEIQIMDITKSILLNILSK